MLNSDGFSLLPVTATHSYAPVCTVWSALGRSVSCDVSPPTILTLKLSPVSIMVPPFRQNRLSGFVKEQLIVRALPSLTVRSPGVVVNCPIAKHTRNCVEVDNKLYFTDS